MEARTHHRESKQRKGTCKVDRRSTWTPCRVDEFSSICIADHVPLSLPPSRPRLAEIKAKKYGNVDGYSDSFPIARVHFQIEL